MKIKFTLLFLLIYTTAFAQIDRDTVHLKEVMVTNSKYLKLEGYIRSWRIKNDTLVDFCDDIIEYKYPLNLYKSKNSIKKKLLQFRNFYLETKSKKPKKLITISFGLDYYAYSFIPKYDLFSEHPNKDYTIEKSRNIDSVYTVKYKGEVEGEITYFQNNKHLIDLQYEFS